MITVMVGADGENSDARSSSGDVAAYLWLC